MYDCDDMTGIGVFEVVFRMGRWCVGWEGGVEGSVGGGVNFF